MSKIRFTKNWNNKLGCNIFTTIRPLKSNYYKFGRIYDIWLNDKFLFKASIKVMKRGYLTRGKNTCELDVHELMIDTGLEDDEEILKIFEGFYGKEKAIEQEYVLLVLQKAEGMG